MQTQVLQLNKPLKCGDKELYPLTQHNQIIDRFGKRIDYNVNQVMSVNNVGKDSNKNIPITRDDINAIPIGENTLKRTLILPRSTISFNQGSASDIQLLMPIKNFSFFVGKIRHMWSPLSPLRTATETTGTEGDKVVHWFSLSTFEYAKSNNRPITIMFYTFQGEDVAYRINTSWTTDINSGQLTIGPIYGITPV